MTATAQPPATPAEQTNPLDDAQLEASSLLTQLNIRADQLQALRDSNQTRLFVPRATREAIGRQYVADRLAQAAARAAGYPSTLGNTHTPGNMAAWTLLAQIETDLVDIRRRILDAHSQRGSCALPRRVYDRPTKTTLFTVTRDLIWATPTVNLARHVNRLLGHLIEEAERIVEGDGRGELGGECPHCRGRTLVWNLEAGTVCCDRPRDRSTGRRPLCKCSNPLCGCRLDPAGYVHTWYRDRRPGDPDSWQALASRLDALAGRLNVTHLTQKRDRT